jgi:hypothetical protein
MLSKPKKSINGISIAFFKLFTACIVRFSLDNLPLSVKARNLVSAPGSRLSFLLGFLRHQAH